MGKWLCLGRLDRQQLRWSILNPLLQIFPQSQPTAVEGLAGTIVLHTQLNELGPVGNQFTSLCAEINGVICMHIRRLGSLE